MIWDSHSGTAEESSLLGCNVFSLHTHPTTQCHILEDLNLQGLMMSGKLKYLYFILFIPCILLQSLYPPTNALNKIQSLKLLHLWALGCHLQGLIKQRNISPTRWSRYYIARISQKQEYYPASLQSAFDLMSYPGESSNLVCGWLLRKSDDNSKIFVEKKNKLLRNYKYLLLIKEVNNTSVILS